MESHDLDADKDGNVIVYPLVGYSAFVAFEMVCGLRLEDVKSEEMIGKKARRLATCVDA
jgi:hypothetical protein